jgi:hypothetical protein
MPHFKPEPKPQNMNWQIKTLNCCNEVLTHLLSSVIYISGAGSATLLLTVPVECLYVVEAAGEQKRTSCRDHHFLNHSIRNATVFN